MIDVNIRVELKVGDEYMTIKDLNPLDETQVTDIVHEKGQVSMIFISHDFEEAAKELGYNQEILEMREDWAGKVKLYGISLLNDQEQIKKLVSDNGWDKY